MAHDPDSGLVKRGLVLLILMLLLMGAVLFIVFQPRQATSAPESARAEDMAWSVAVPSAPFPANISWGALQELSEYVPSPVGWEVRQNAWATLARRGSDHVPWREYREMLDLKRATANAREQLKDTQEQPEGSARTLVIAALKAVAEWHAKRRQANKTDIPDGLAAVYEDIDRLAESPILEIRDEAKKTQATLFRAG
jgi:hypothetical protein